MNPSYNNSPSQGQPPIFSSNPAPTPPSQISSPSPVPSQPISSGDIILPSSSPKKSKKPLVIGLIIIALLALAAVIIAVVLNNKTTSSKTEEIINFIQNGDSSIDYSILTSDEKSDYQLSDSIMAIRISESSSPTEISDYYETLNSKIAELKKESQSGDAQKLIMIATVLDKTINYQTNLKALQKSYQETNYDSVISQIQAFAITSDSSIIQAFSNRYIKYYEQSIEEYNLFSAHNCISGSIYDYQCADEAGLSAQIIELESDIVENRNFLTNPDLLKSLNFAIEQQIKEGN